MQGVQNDSMVIALTHLVPTFSQRLSDKLMHVDWCKANLIKHVSMVIAPHHTCSHIISLAVKGLIL